MVFGNPLLIHPYPRGGLLTAISFLGPPISLIPPGLIMFQAAYINRGYTFTRKNLPKWAQRLFREDRKGRIHTNPVYIYPLCTEPKPFYSVDCFLAEQHRSNGNYKTRYILHSQREYKVRYMARSILCVDAEKPPPVRAAAWIKLWECPARLPTYTPTA